MLTIDNILWVIPGVVFVNAYNRIRTLNHIDLSGWPYVFFLVLVASATWIPARFLVQEYGLFVDGYKNESILLVAILFVFVGILVIWFKISWSHWLFPGIRYDNFCLKCIELEGEVVFMTLKNEKVYMGILWKYPESPRSRHESQSVSVVPLQSGFRSSEDKRIIWNIKYHYDSGKDMEDMETVIPRSEIVTFGKFSEKTHQRFAGNGGSFGTIIENR